MVYVVEHLFDIDYFDFWGSADEVVADFKKRGKLKNLENMIKAAFDSDEYVTDEMINLFVLHNAYDFDEDLYA